MAEIEASLPVYADGGGTGSGGYYAPSPYKQSGQQGQPQRRPASASPRDSVSVHGIPPQEITPAVRRALDSLFHELEEERHAHEQLQARVEFLEQKGDTHFLYPVLNEQAFLRELWRRLEHFKQTGLMGCLVGLDVREYFAVRRVKGLRQAEGFILRFVENLQTSLRRIDLTGFYGETKIVLFMPFYKESDAASFRTRQAFRADVHFACVEFDPAVHTHLTLFEEMDHKLADQNVIR